MNLILISNILVYNCYRPPFSANKQTAEVHRFFSLDPFQVILAFIGGQMSKGYYMGNMVEITVL